MALLCQNASSSQPTHAETKAQRDARMLWWKEARFGMFIHWGLYSIPAGEWAGNQEKHPFLGTEWLMAYRSIPVAEYRKLAQQFHPTQFNAEAWVLAAKNAGMKYIVLTAKHHDGFALFDSAVSDFDVVDATPFKRDIVKELAEACQKHGMKLGLYYSQAQDWTHKGGAVATFIKRWDPSHEGSFSEYLDKVAVPQVREILSKYGPISVIWWDTPQDMTPELAARFQDVLTLQSGIVQNSRLTPGGGGDFRVFEGNVPSGGVPGTPWEVCVMMNESWGYSRVHHEWASATKLIRDLIHTASLGGNLLLNVGPDASGTFPPEAMSRLDEIGQWMKRNGEAIYGTSGFPLKKPWQQGRLTRKPGKLYASVFLWPPDGKLTIPVAGSIKSVRRLDEPEKALAFASDAGGITVEVGRVMPDPVATVFVLEFDGNVTESATRPPLGAGRGGEFDLLAAYAVPAGEDPAKPAVVIGRREGTTPPLTGDPMEGLKLGGFVTPRERAEWRIRIPGPGRYGVVAYVGLHKGMPSDAAIEIRAGAQTLQKTIPVTGDSQTFRPLDLGVLTFEKAGDYVLEASLDLKTGSGSGGQIWRVMLRPQDSKNE